jgi:DNA-binding NtrC family response regulator
MTHNLMRSTRRSLSKGYVAEALSIIVGVQRLDVLFTDIALQDEIEGGLTVGKVFAECHPNLPVLYATGGGVSNRMRAAFAEPYGFIAKPYSAEQLRIAVNNLRTSSRQSYS